jgi:hypothetical protein
MSWIAIAVAAAALVATLFVGAQAFADRDSSRCAQPQPVATAHHGESWRTGALRVVGCRAWRHMHHPRRSFIRLGR